MATSSPRPETGAEEDSRRLSIRRARGAFSGGQYTTSESLRTSDASNQPTDPDLRTRTLRAIAGPTAPPQPVDNEPPSEENRRRLAEAVMTGDPSYARDLRLNLIQRLLLRNIALDAIARDLGVSLSTVKQDVAEIKKRMRERARGLDINELVGNQLSFYDEARAMSMRISSLQGAPAPIKLAAIRTALASQADMTRFLSSAGVLDVLAYRKAENGTAVSDISVVMSRTEEVLDRLLSEAERPRPRYRPRPRVGGGFSSMSFEDRDSSNSSDEVVDL